MNIKALSIIAPLVTTSPALADLEVFTNADLAFTLNYYHAISGPPEGVGLNITIDATSQSAFFGWPQLQNTFGIWADDPTTSLGWGNYYIIDETDVQVASGTESTPLDNGSYETTYAPVQTFQVGDFIGPTDFTGGPGKDVKVFSWGSSSLYSPVDGTAYVGISIVLEGQTHYGWVLLTDDYPAGANIQPIAWAYETEPGVPAEIVDPFATDCPADTNGDGMLSPADFTAWIAAFNAQAPQCDQNGDSLCTSADFTAWIAGFNAGC